MEYMLTVDRPFKIFIPESMDPWKDVQKTDTEYIVNICNIYVATIKDKIR